MKTCARCEFKPALTALWQVGFTFRHRFVDYPPMFVCSSVVVCGMCADLVNITDFGEQPERLAQYMTGRVDAMTFVDVELRMDDISDGLWRDPQLGGSTRVPV